MTIDTPEPITPRGTKPQALDPLRGGLTARQDQFAKNLAEGKTVTDAYLDAYENQRARPRSSISCDAAKLKGDPRIQARIAWHMARIDRYTSYNPAKLRAIALETIMQVAGDERNRPADRLKAAELLGRVTGVGLFESAVEPGSITRINSALDLESKLRQLAGLHQPAITVQPIDITKEVVEQSAE